MRNGKKVIVIKIGSSTLVNEQGKLDRAYFDGLAAQVHALRQMGWSPLIVSSAAIACGLEALGIEERPTDMPSLQAAASVGQNALMATYAEAFSRYDVLTSCVLITRHSTAQRNAYLHARDTLERLIDFDVVPIINENDTVATEEMGIGDNDTLAAVVAVSMEADLLILLSDIDGLYTADPHTHPEATLIAEIPALTREIWELAGGSGSSLGTGGMSTKLQAADICTQAGCDMVIANGSSPSVLYDIADGKPVGSRFRGKKG